jgi:hypothetical protein
VTVGEVRPVGSARPLPAGSQCMKQAQWTYLGDSHLDGGGVANEPLFGQQQTENYEPHASQETERPAVASADCGP